MADSSHRDFYDRIAEVYDFLADSSERRVLAEGIFALDVQPREWVLELGCGTGQALVELAEAAGPDGRIVGLDISAGMLGVARRRLDDESATAGVDTGVVRLVLGDARRAPFPDGTFDAIFLSFTLELFEDDERPAVLAECRRLLRPGGRLGLVAMAEPGRGERDSLLEKGYRWMQRRFPHIVDCRPIDVAKEIQAAGFRLDRLKSREIWTMPVRAAVGVKEAA